MIGDGLRKYQMVGNHDDAGQLVKNNKYAYIQVRWSDFDRISSTLITFNGR